MPASSLQRNVEPVLLEEKENVAFAELVGLAGPEPIVTVGAVVSIVQAYVLLPVFPAVSVAVTLQVWPPAARPVTAAVGLVQLAGVPESSWQTNVELGLLDANANEALVELVGFPGVLLKVTTGAVVSIVHVDDAVPMLPAGSVAVTVNVWLPAASEE